MANELGRISGPLLSANLLRNGIDLAFDTDLLYLRVPPNIEGSSPFEDGDPSWPNGLLSEGIGINTDVPTHTLHVNGTTESPYVKVDKQADLANLTVFLNKIQNIDGPIYITPNQLTDPKIIATRFETLNLGLSDNVIENITNSSTISDDINLDATGRVEFITDKVNVNGNLHATGNISWSGGSINIGNNNNDSIIFNSDFTSNIVPNINYEYDLGTLDKKWKSIFSNNVVLDKLITNDSVVNNIDLLSTSGNTIYVSVNGNDNFSSGSTSFTGNYDNDKAYNIGDIVFYNSLYYKRIASPLVSGILPTDDSTWLITTLSVNTGQHNHSPFRTIKHALSVAEFGDEIVIFPGTYIEDFPLVVPQGVSIRGAGIRAVSIEPSIKTNTNDAFLLNGDTTVEFLSIQNFYQGYAFKLVPNFKTLRRSPYVYNVTVITKGIPPNASVYIDGWYVVLGDPNSGVYGQSWRILELSGTINGKNAYQYVDETVFWNGTEWEFDNISLGIIATGQGDTEYPWEATWSGIFTANPYGGTHDINDPMGYNQGNAGNGFYVDGSQADPTTEIIPSFLLYSVTLIIPNAKGIVGLNKVQIECLNSFSYYAHTGIELLAGQAGFANQGTTKVTFDGIVGSVAVGDTLTYLSDDESTVLATGTIVNITDNIYSLDGNIDGLLTINEMLAAQYVIHGSAKISTTKYKYASGSLYLNGIESYIDTADSYDFSFKNNDFCIECWIYPESYPSNETAIISHWGNTSASQAFKLSFVDTGEIVFYLNNGSIVEIRTGVEYLLSETGDIFFTEDGDEFIKETPAILLNEWQHIAVSRLNDTVTIYIDGVLKTSVTLSPNFEVSNSTNRFSIGFSEDLTEYFHGYVDELRVSKNNSRYSEAFIVSTSEFMPDVYTTSLLHFNGTNNSTKIIDDSPITQNIQFTNATARFITSLDYRDFGSELRSINSANIYGEYGAVANGRGALGYLIGHNFGYIGSKDNSENDISLVNQPNEVVKSNFGIIYYDSTDHKGDYRIGDVLYINQETGAVSVNAESINFGPEGSITLEGLTSSTYINKDYVQTGNIKIYDNTVQSLSGPINFQSPILDNIYLNTDINITGNLDVSNNVKVSGNVYLGDSPFDQISIFPNLTQDINPNVTNFYNLGSQTNRWNTLYATLIDVDGTIQVTLNSITTLTTNTDLKLLSTNEIAVQNTDVEVENNFTVNSLFVSNYVETVTSTTADTFLNTDISITDNTITTLNVNQNLVLSADNLGKVNVQTTDVEILNDLTVVNETITTDVIINGLLQIEGTYYHTGNKFQTGNTEITQNVDFVGESQFYDFNINDNIIQTTNTDSPFVIQANGSGIINVQTSNVEVNTNLTVDNNTTINGETNLLNTSIVGDIEITGDINQTGNTYIAGTFNTNSFDIVGDSYFEASGIRFYQNIISNEIIDADIILKANGTGGVTFDSTLKIVNNEIVNSNSNATTDLQKSIVFDPNGTGNVTINSTKSLILPIGNNTTRILSSVGEIRYNDLSNMVEGWTPVGYTNFMNLWDSDRNTYITAELTPGNNDQTIRFATNGTVTTTIDEEKLVSSTFQIDNVSFNSDNITDNSQSLNIAALNDRIADINGIQFNDSTISNTTSGSLILKSTGVGYVKFVGTNGVIIPFGTIDQRRLLPEVGETRYNTELEYLEVFNGETWQPAHGTEPTIEADEAAEIMDIWSLILG